MEHLRHFGLAQDPFQNDPLSRLYFASHEHADAERRLLRGLRQAKSLAVLLGEHGSGKSTIARHLLDSLEEEKFEASMMVVLQGETGSNWFLTRIARQLGVEEPTAERGGLVTQIFNRLVDVREEGRHSVVLIDGAHQLRPREDLGELKALLHLEHDERHLLTVVLVGLPELGERLAADSAVAQRVEVRVALSGLDVRSTGEYVAHRVRAAGGDPRIFEPTAVEVLCCAARGLPRIVNTLADNALFEAHLVGRRTVSPTDVLRAAQDLGIPAPEGSVDAQGIAAPSAARPAGPSATMLDETSREGGRPVPQATLEADAEDAPIFEAGSLGADPFQGPGDVSDDGPPKEEEIEGLFVDLIDEER
ncbi:MAG TPA: AAA family ATPase [Deltaproteobacteria bacterium]|nr:AAA family ATPase [Deltaproteobacteria bacterium]